MAPKERALFGPKERSALIRAITKLFQAERAGRIRLTQATLNELTVELLVLKGGA